MGADTRGSVTPSESAPAFSERTSLFQPGWSFVRARVDRDPAGFVRLSPEYKGPKGHIENARSVSVRYYRAFASGTRTLSDLAAWDTISRDCHAQDSVAVDAWNPLVFIAVALLLAAVAVAAMFRPAVRAAGSDPMKALREE
jgi:hypothetical protein